MLNKGLTPRPQRLARLWVCPAVLLLCLLVVFGRSYRPVTQLKKMHRDLEARGKRLVLVSMPYRSELYPSDNSAFDHPRILPHRYTLQSGVTKFWLRKQGVTVLELDPTIRAAAGERDIYDPANRFYFAESGKEIASKALGKLLEAKDVITQKESPDQITLMGDCFAVEFGLRLRKKHAKDQFRLLRAFGDQGRVGSLLYLFESEYIAPSDTVVWLISNRNLARTGFPKIQTKINQDGETVTLEAQVLSHWGQSFDEVKSKTGTLLYANAVGCLKLRTKDPEIGSVTAFRYLIRKREAQGIAGVNRGDTLAVTLTPYATWIAVHPNDAKQQVYNLPEDFDLPEYWIVDWTKLVY
jgi:hypothetical protein